MLNQHSHISKTTLKRGRIGSDDDLKVLNKVSQPLQKCLLQVGKEISDESTEQMEPSMAAGNGKSTAI